MQILDWESAPAGLRLKSNRVDIWRVNLDDDSLSFPLNVLSSEEKGKAARFFLGHDRIRFLRRRTRLRQILGGYLGCSPETLSFLAGPNGKPTLLDVPSLQFSVSSADGMALFAITKDREVGIDVERIVPEFCWQPIACHFFSALENEFLLRLPESRRVASFFEIFTRKEAFAKAHGQGLAFVLDQIKVPMLSAFEQIEGYTISSVDLGKEWAGALAMEGDILTLRMWEWTDVS